MDKPRHPDAETLMAAVRSTEGLSRQDVPVPQVLGGVADPPSAMYAAIQVAKRIAPQLRRSDDATLAAALAGAWLDGMLAGYRLCEAHEMIEQEQ